MKYTPIFLKTSPTVSNSEKYWCQVIGGLIQMKQPHDDFLIQHLNKKNKKEYKYNDWIIPA